MLVVHAAGHLEFVCKRVSGRGIRRAGINASAPGVTLHYLVVVFKIIVVYQVVVVITMAGRQHQFQLAKLAAVIYGRPEAVSPFQVGRTYFHHVRIYVYPRVVDYVGRISGATEVRLPHKHAAPCAVLQVELGAREEL